MEGDRNTRYYHLIANGKHRKQRVFQVEQEDGIIRGDVQLKKYITNYYKDLFGPAEVNHLSMIEAFTDDMAQVSDEENIYLTKPFAEKEVQDAIFQMDHNKAVGPDGFLAEFYQVFWEVIKNDLMAMFHAFHSCTLSIFSLNFGIITLLPKKIDAKQIQQYRPICMLNVCFLLK